MAIEIVAASKQNLADEDAVKQAIAKLRPDQLIENIVEKDGEWLVRLADKPPFLQDKDPDDDGDDDTSPATDTDDNAGTDDSSDDSDSKDKSDKSDKSDSKSDSKGDVAGELKDLIGQLQDVLKQVQDKAGDAVKQVEDHQDKLDKAKDALGDDGDVGPVPGGGPGPDGLPLSPVDAPVPGDLGAGPVPPKGGPKPPHRPGVPSGGAPKPGVPSAFAKRRTEIVSHSGRHENGASMTLLEAANQLQSDPEWSDYEVVGMTENADGSFSAKLRLR